MRSRVPWLVAGLAAAAAAVGFLRRPQGGRPEPWRQETPEPPPPDPDARAEELRRRIDESRGIVDERDEFEAAETPVDEADPETRRRDVHARGRETLDRMRGELPPKE